MTVVINGTTGVSGVDGSAGTPAVQGTDTNTGEFFPAADTIAWTTGGSERMRVDSSGNVGIGTNSPGQRLQISNTSSSGFAAIRLAADARTYDFGVGGSASGFNPYAIYIYDVSAAATRMVIDANGIAMFNTNSQLIRGGETFRNNGGTGIASFYSSVNGPVIAIKNNYAVSTYQIAFNNNTQECGTITTGSNTVGYNSNSDYRLKEDVKPMVNALQTVSALKPVTYKWKSDGSAGQGFIAHELAEVVPEAVSGEKDAVNEDGSIKAQGIDTSFLVATLTAAIQELTARVQALEAKA